MEISLLIMEDGSGAPQLAQIQHLTLGSLTLSLNHKILILDGEFIKKFIPELKDVPVAQIHQPKSDLFSSTNYPAPMLDLKESRVRAIQAFKDARENTSI